MTSKFQIRSLHQIEMTSICNLRCRYCPSPNLQRPKLHMSDEHYIQALRWAKYFITMNGPMELNLAGIGESTMHPEFVRNVHLAREAVGSDVDVVLATNGILMDDAMAQAIAPAKPKVWVSLHRPERAALAVQALRRAKIYNGASADPAIAAMNWAGQVKWEVSVPERRPCAWVRGGFVMAMADGRITRCCLDASGIGVFATLDDDLSQAKTSPYSLCRTCDQDVGVPIPMENVA